jgi:primosomal protein N' (replication factor Y) (superfamily II helicase)
MRVRVPFGREVLTGYVIAVTPLAETARKPIKDVIARLDDAPTINQDLLAITQWVADRYLAALGSCLRLAFPGHAAPQRSERSLEDVAPRHPPCLKPQPVPASLASAGSRLLNAIAQHTHESILVVARPKELEGLYGAAVRATLRMNRSALALVPATDRIEPMRQLLEREAGAPCEIYHGLLPLDQRRQAWARIQAGLSRVVVGTRSAVFVPLAGLGLALVDQEHSRTYKAENAPRYDARVIAAERARQAGAVLVLSSAHPSVEAICAAGGTTQQIFPQSRAGPMVRVVNLRESPGEIVSATLRDAIAAHLSRRNKVVLFLNRKGYASVLLCRDCGRALQCPACAVGWTYHKKDRILRCARCGRSEGVPERCPDCKSDRLFPCGLGTEALQETLAVQFPGTRIRRWEAGHQARRRAETAASSEGAPEEFDILIGTELLATRAPHPKVSLIGIVAPDAALHLPDFRAAERAYHTLCEIMALVDEQSPDAEIIIQSYVPEHYVIRALEAGNPSLFYETELNARAALQYPPYGKIIGLYVSGTRQDHVAAAAERWAMLLRAEFRACGRKERSAPASTPSMSEIELLGPIPAMPSRVRGRFRWQLILKDEDDQVLRQSVRATLAKMETETRRGNLRYDVDVDPESLAG